MSTSSYSTESDGDSPFAIMKRLDALVDGWITPVRTPDYAHSYELRPEELLSIAAACEVFEGTVYGDHRLQFTIDGRARKVYEVPDATGKLRSVLARLATVIDEMRHPELLTITGNSPDDERRKYELRENSVHGFDTTFDFIESNMSVESRTTRLRVETSNGLPVSERVQGVGFIIERKHQAK